MIPATENRTLFQTLQGLYSRIVSAVLDRRVKSYRKQSSAKSWHDIATPLAEQIKQLAASADTNSKQPPPADLPDGTQSNPVENSRNSHRSYPQSAEIADTVNELSTHFKQRQGGSALNPEVGEKLRNSARDHIHAALRLARQGQVDAAGMHADIANQAIREAAHYMSEQEYARFIAEVEGELPAR